MHRNPPKHLTEAVAPKNRKIATELGRIRDQLSNAIAKLKGGDDFDDEPREIMVDAYADLEKFERHM